MVQKSTMPTPHSGGTPAAVHRVPGKGSTPTAPGTVTTPGKPNTSGGDGQSVMTTAGLTHGSVTGSGHGSGGNSGK